MINLKFKGKKVSDNSWTVSESFEHATPDNVFVGDNRVYPKSVGLFTGLHDIDGEPVFGGDILISFKSMLPLSISTSLSFGIKTTPNFKLTASSAASSQISPPLKSLIGKS